MNILTVDFDPTNHSHRKSLATQLQIALRNAGFEEVPRQLGRYAPKEKIFSKRVDLPTLEELLGEPCPGKMTVRVYSSILFTDEVRGCGADSIKVAAVYVDRNGNTRGIGSDTRIHRTGTIEKIVERLHMRLANVFKTACHPERCADCGAPKFKSKKGNMVCAEMCWKNPEIRAKKVAQQVQQQVTQAAANNAPHPHPWIAPSVPGVPF